MSFLELDDMISSKMSHTVFEDGSKMWQCHECDYVQSRKSDVTKHIERKHLDLQISCPYCSNVFKERIKLKEHMKISHNVV